MHNFRFFVEGIADRKFIRDYIANSFGVTLNDTSFDTLRGHGGYKAGGTLKKSIQENHDNGRQTILILDADQSYTLREKEVLADFHLYNVPVHLFLFPNNKDIGNLETILTTIAAERKLIDCFACYETCVADYKIPLYKARIYSYLDVLLAPEQKLQGGDLRQENNRDYSNSAHWNLRHEYLNPFHEFLKRFF